MQRFHLVHICMSYTTPVLFFSSLILLIGEKKGPVYNHPPLVWLTAGAQRTKYHDDNRAEAKEYIQRGSKGEGDTR